MSIFTDAAYMLGHVRTEDHVFFNRIVDPFATTSENIANTYGGSFPSVTGGERIALNVLSKNPLMTRPTVAGLRYFGQNPISKVCMDQPLARRMGQFPTPQHGSGMNFYDFNINPNFRGAQNVSALTGTLLYGSQFKNVSGATALISGSLSSIVVGAITNLLSDSLPASLQSAIPGLSSIVGALSGGGSLTDTYRLFSTFTFTDPVSSVLSSSIIGAVGDFLGGNPLSTVASRTNSILSTAQSFSGNLNTISPGLALSGIGNGTYVLQNAIDQAINTAIPGASMIISNTLNSVTQITGVTGASSTEVVRINDTNAIIPFAAGAAQVFALKDKDPFGLDTYSRGYSMSNAVISYINKRNARAV